MDPCTSSLEFLHRLRLIARVWAHWDTYDGEVKNTIDRLLAIFTPVITLLLAVMIGTIVLSVLMAILSINDLVA